jgi:hypothetical protein
LNRLLAWWADPEAEHKMGTEFLKRLALLVNLPAMVDDLDRGNKPEITSEEGVDDDQSGKQPDLTVWTVNAALLLENKLWSPESGDQYAPYLQVLRRLAGKSRQRRAILCAPDQRAVPRGWDCSIQHDDLVQIFDELSHLEGAPLWRRISAAIRARSFSTLDVDKCISEAHDLMKETAQSRITLDQISRLRAALPLLIFDSYALKFWNQPRKKQEYQ